MSWTCGVDIGFYYCDGFLIMGKRFTSSLFNFAAKDVVIKTISVISRLVRN